MKLYFLRHGKADWPDWIGDDDERPLTEAGRKEVRRVAKFLREIGASPQLILSSPLPRAAQTAQIAHKYLGGELIEEVMLSPLVMPRGIRALLKHYDADEVMLVGHEPDFSTAIRAFCGGRVKMAKAGAARVDLDEDGKGRLIWLLPPKMAR